MANIERVVEQASDKLGNQFGNGIIDSATILQMLQAGRIRIAEFDNALLVEIDGETYSLPDGFQVNKFP